MIMRQKGFTLKGYSTVKVKVTLQVALRLSQGQGKSLPLTIVKPQNKQATSATSGGGAGLNNPEQLQPAQDKG